MKEITGEQNKRRCHRKTFEHKSAGNYEGNKRGRENGDVVLKTFELESAGKYEGNNRGGRVTETSSLNI
jgi:hypothetical protein